MAAPLVVVDAYEHAFSVDYRNNRAEYVETFLTFADWAEAEKRYRAVVKG
ncbi:Fe-Mn family superoxide dismutase [Gemmata sp.]